MKIAVIVLAVCIGLVCGEGCQDDNDCQWEHCSGTGWSVACNHGVLTGIIGGGGSNGGTCTCVQDGASGSTCAKASDCSTMRCPSNFLSGHCIDSHCHCSFDRPGK